MTSAKFVQLCGLLFALIFVAGCAEPSDQVLNPSLQLPTETPQEITPTNTIQAVNTGEEDFYEKARTAMVEKTIEARGISNIDVLRAMQSVPRHEFVPSEYRAIAYIDDPLPIGYGQTISQPYMVAWMTELLELEAGEKVLEIGTGSGYQAAILAEYGDINVFSIEIVPELADIANSRLGDLGYAEVELRQGDGYFGWPEQAPFDAIIVTAAPDHLPAPLIEQLDENGRIVIPIGPPGGFQTLWKFVFEDGELKGYNLGFVAFVPFTGEGVRIGPATEIP